MQGRRGVMDVLCAVWRRGRILRTRFCRASEINAELVHVYVLRVVLTIAADETGADLLNLGEISSFDLFP